MRSDRSGGAQTAGHPPPHRHCTRGRETCAYAKGQHQKLGDEQPLVADEKMVGTAEKVVDAVDVNGREYKRIRINGCWYRSLDTEAGIRTYNKPRGFKFWHGYYNTKAIDHYTGAPLAIVVSSPSKSEFHIYPELKESVKATIGATPRSVVADKGFSVESAGFAATRTSRAPGAPTGRQAGSAPTAAAGVSPTCRSRHRQCRGCHRRGRLDGRCLSGSSPIVI